jgi:hypothetical protein
MEPSQPSASSGINAVGGRSSSNRSPSYETSPPSLDQWGDRWGDTNGTNSNANPRNLGGLTTAQSPLQALASGHTSVLPDIITVTNSPTLPSCSVVVGTDEGSSTERTQNLLSCTGNDRSAAVDINARASSTLAFREVSMLVLPGPIENIYSTTDLCLLGGRTSSSATARARAFCAVLRPTNGDRTSTVYPTVIFPVFQAGSGTPGNSNISPYRLNMIDIKERSFTTSNDKYDPSDLGVSRRSPSRLNSVQENGKRRASSHINRRILGLKQISQYLLVATEGCLTLYKIKVRGGCAHSNVDPVGSIDVDKEEDFERNKYNSSSSNSYDNITFKYCHHLDVPYVLLECDYLKLSDDLGDKNSGQSDDHQMLVATDTSGNVHTYEIHRKKLSHISSSSSLPSSSSLISFSSSPIYHSKDEIAGKSAISLLMHDVLVSAIKSSSTSLCTRLSLGDDRLRGDFCIVSGLSNGEIHWNIWERSKTSQSTNKTTSDNMSITVSSTNSNSNDTINNCSNCSNSNNNRTPVRADHLDNELGLGDEIFAKDCCHQRGSIILEGVVSNISLYYSKRSPDSTKELVEEIEEGHLLGMLVGLGVGAVAFIDVAHISDSSTSLHGNKLKDNLKLLPYFPSRGCVQCVAIGDVSGHPRCFDIVSGFYDGTVCITSPVLSSNSSSSSGYSPVRFSEVSFVDKWVICVPFSVIGLSTGNIVPEVAANNTISNNNSNSNNRNSDNNSNSNSSSNNNNSNNNNNNNNSNKNNNKNNNNTISSSNSSVRGGIATNSKNYVCVYTTKTLHIFGI